MPKEPWYAEFQRVLMDDRYCQDYIGEIALKNKAELLSLMEEKFGEKMLDNRDEGTHATT